MVGCVSFLWWVCLFCARMGEGNWVDVWVLFILYFVGLGGDGGVQYGGVATTSNKFQV